jgi:hypothetical protein
LGKTKNVIFIKVIFLCPRIKFLKLALSQDFGDNSQDSVLTFIFELAGQSRCFYKAAHLAMLQHCSLMLESAFGAFVSVLIITYSLSAVIITYSLAVTVTKNQNNWVLI